MKKAIRFYPSGSKMFLQRCDHVGNISNVAAALSMPCKCSLCFSNATVAVISFYMDVFFVTLERRFKNNTS